MNGKKLIKRSLLVLSVFELSLIGYGLGSIYLEDKKSQSARVRNRLLALQLSGYPDNIERLVKLFNERRLNGASQQELQSITDQLLHATAAIKAQDIIF